jgi:hypothetical protein
MNQDEIKKVEADLIENIKKLKYALGQFETDTGILLTGDANGAYWNGPNAFQCLKTCAIQINFDLQLVDNLEKNTNHFKS